jgi:spore maturation protein CgeB
VKMKIVVIGLSITSSWGNGHATTYRGLIRELAERGHEIIFLERDAPWYADNRDCPKCKFCKIGLYRNLQQLRTQFASCIQQADLVIVGSYVPDGIWIGEWVNEVARGVTAFYDIDTPVTLGKLERNQCDYLSLDLIPRYRLYLSFTGGPTLRHLELKLGSPMARALHCSVDPTVYFSDRRKERWSLGYLGTYSDDRQPALTRLMLDAAATLPREQFVVAGPQYPETVIWPNNVARITHLAPNLHRGFYNEQKFTLNLTRADMKRAGYSPSVRLFEAAACGTPIISDYWDGLETLLEPGKEILISHSGSDTVQYLLDVPAAERRQIGERARKRILSEHTSAHRAAELEAYVADLIPNRSGSKTGRKQTGPKVVTSRKVFYERVG